MSCTAWDSLCRLGSPGNERHDLVLREASFPAEQMQMSSLAAPSLMPCLVPCSVWPLEDSRPLVAVLSAPSGPHGIL
jgi:hypothetical protein